MTTSSDSYENFFVQASRGIFTIHSWFAPEKVIAQIYGLFPSKKKPVLRILKEIGSTGHKHMHIIWKSARVKLQSARKWQKFAKALGSFDHKVISDDKHFLNALQYDQKKDKVNGKDGQTSEVVYCDEELKDWKPAMPYHHEVIDFIQNCNSWYEVVSSKSYSEYISTKMNWARDVYALRPRKTKYEFPDKKPLEWQSELIDTLSKPCTDDRTITWIHDDVGGNGKSKLSDYLIDHHGAFLVDGGSMRDIAYAYDHQPIVIFDLPRDTEDYCPYRTMEAFKNGRIFSAKYKSVQKRFDVPHVIVLANYLPRLLNQRGKKTMSMDRWNIQNLDNFEFTSIDVHALLKEQSKCLISADDEEDTDFVKVVLPKIMKKNKKKKASKGVSYSVKTPPEKLRSKSIADLKSRQSQEPFTLNDVKKNILDKIKHGIKKRISEKKAIQKKANKKRRSN